MCVFPYLQYRTEDQQNKLKIKNRIGNKTKNDMSNLKLLYLTFLTKSICRLSCNVSRHVFRDLLRGWGQGERIPPYLPRPPQYAHDCKPPLTFNIIKLQLLHYSPTKPPQTTSLFLYTFSNLHNFCFTLSPEGVPTFCWYLIMKF